MKKIIAITSLLFLFGCSGVNSIIADSEKVDEKAMIITDEWALGDSQKVAQGIVENFKSDLNAYEKLKGKKVFYAFLQNKTDESYFPIDEFNVETRTKLEDIGTFYLVDENVSAKIIEKLSYQNDGMVGTEASSDIYQRTGASYIIQGGISKKMVVIDGRKVKEYSVMFSINDAARDVEIFRTILRSYKNIELE